MKEKRNFKWYLERICCLLLCILIGVLAALGFYAFVVITLLLF